MIMVISMSSFLVSSDFNSFMTFMWFIRVEPVTSKGHGRVSLENGLFGVLTSFIDKL